MSEVGATLQFSLHRFANPLTTSALLPMSRNNPMTFFRQVPILSHQFSRREEVVVLGHAPSQHVTLFSVLQDQHQLVDAVDFVFNTLNQGTKRVRDVIDESVRDPIRSNVDVILELFYPPSHVLRVGCRAEVELERLLCKIDAGC